MNAPELLIKLSYITGLKPVVLDELTQAGFEIAGEAEDSLFVPFSEESISEVKKLRSVARAYLVLQGEMYHPAFISNHKSVLGELVDIVSRHDVFKTFKISCAGSESREVRSIAAYVQDTYKLREADEADLKIHIIKLGDVWEVGMQITTRPLSVRQYRAVNMSGAMDPTIAYAVNTFCNLDSARSYLNVFSGSGTLLIEAAQRYPAIERFLGFDNDKKHLSLSIQNIQKAGLIQKVQVKEADIFERPEFGTFDAITSDLPFGMVIAKDEDLRKLYTAFVRYCEGALNPGGRLVVYTSEHKLFESVLAQSAFAVAESLQLKFMTNVDAYLKPKIFVCELKTGQ